MQRIITVGHWLFAKREAVFRGIRNSGITEQRNKLFYAFTGFLLTPMPRNYYYIPATEQLTSKTG